MAVGARFLHSNAASPPIKASLISQFHLEPSITSQLGAFLRSQFGTSTYDTTTFSEVEFVNAVTAGGSVKFLPAV